MPWRILTITLLLVGCGISEPQPINERGFDSGEHGRGPGLMIIGDSQSTGVLASTTMGEQPPDQLISNLIPFFYSNNPSLANLQAHFSEYRNAAVATDLAWGLRATLARLHQLEPTDIPLYLAAQWGGKLRHLPELLEKAEAGFALQDGATVEYLVLMLGANDLCTGESSKVFEASFASNFQTLLAQYPGTMMLVAAIPPIPQLLRYSHNYNEFLTCDQVRKRFCPAMFAEDFKQHYQEYNASIERVIRQLRANGHTKVILVDGFRTMFFQASMLAFDCFHPNNIAQKQYAQFFEEALLRDE